MSYFWFYVFLIPGYLIWVTYFWKPLKILVPLWIQGVKGPPFYPFVGQLLSLRSSLALRRKKGTAYTISFSALPIFSEFAEKYGSVFVYSLGPLPRMSILDPAMIRQAYVNENECFHKPSTLTSLKIFGQGLLTADGEDWQRQRRLINPAFNHKEIKSMMKTIVECAEEAMVSWGSIIPSSGALEIEMHSELSRVALDAIGKTSFGADLGDKESASIVCDTLKKYFRLGILRARGPGLIPGYMYLPTKLNRELANAEGTIQRLMLDIIRRRRLAKDTSFREPSPVADVVSPTPGRIDLLQLMLSAADPTSSKVPDGSSQVAMTDQQLMDECITFLIAGHETTANLLTWTMLMLSKNPEWQEKGRAEVIQICGETGLPLFEHLHQLKTLGNILSEVLRLFPPASVIARHCVKATKLGDIRIPKGLDIVIPIFTIHRRKELWGDDAEEFRPDRFAGGVSSAGTHPMAFLPFSVGPRTCIGQNFAIVEAKVILAMLLQRFCWRVAPGYRHFPSVDLTLKPTYGLPVLLQKRPEFFESSLAH